MHSVGGNFLGGGGGSLLHLGLLQLGDLLGGGGDGLLGGGIALFDLLLGGLLLGVFSSTSFNSGKTAYPKIFARTLTFSCLLVFLSKLVAIAGHDHGLHSPVLQLVLVEGDLSEAVGDDNDGDDDELAGGLDVLLDWK